MLSQTAEYALRAVTFLAQHSPSAKTTAEIAAATRVPMGYLYKVLQALGRRGIVDSHRGLHGGYALASAPHELTVLDVVNAVDPVQRIRICPLSIHGHTDLCPLHKRLDEAMALVESALGRSSISELLTEPPRSTPFCEAATRASRSSTDQGPRRSRRTGGRSRFQA